MYRQAIEIYVKHTKIKLLLIARLESGKSKLTNRKSAYFNKTKMMNNHSRETINKNNPDNCQYTIILTQVNAPDAHVESSIY